MPLKLLIICLCYSVTAGAIRDIFSIEAKYPHGPGHKLAINDLNFSGTIIQKHQAIGYVLDPVGNIYRIVLGQKLGSARVIKILRDQIWLWDEQQYIVLK